MSKDFGATSGYLEPANKSWEQATWLTGKPPLDREFNLEGEIAQRLVSRNLEIGSGWLYDRSHFSPDIYPKANDGNYINEPGNFRNITVAAPALVANRFYFGPGQIAHLAGMLVNVRRKNDEWLPIDLPAAPAGVGVQRFDLVYLEVWRALVHGDNTITPTHRDINFKIFYNGWVDSVTGDNFVDDVYPGVPATETSKRVQVQWRIRTVAGVDLVTYPDGIDHAAVVFAQGPEAAPTAFTFANQATAGDSSLWVSTGHTNTVDGKVYATPICAVVRRNTTAYDKDTNQNGAKSLAAGGDSLRSDNARYDVILEKDIIDLRKSVARSFNLQELLEKNFGWAMDAKLKTGWGDSGLGGGQRGNVYTNADEIGNVDTPGANLLGDFDGVQKQWSDASSTTENFMVRALASRTVAINPGFWAEGDEFEVALPLTSSGIVDSVVSVSTTSGYPVAMYQVSGLNSQTITFKMIAGFNAEVPLASRTGYDLFVQYSVTYPSGQGLSRDPLRYTASLVTGAALNVLNGGDNLVVESAVPVGMTGMSADGGLYRPSRTATIIGKFTVTNLFVRSRTNATTYVPYFIESVTGIYDNIADPGKTTNLFLSFDGDTGLITHQVVPAAHRNMVVDLVSKDALPNGTQITLYYETPAQQALDGTAGVYNVPTVSVQILHTGNALYTVSGGSGVTGPAYPYARPGSMVPVSDAGFLGEHIYDYGQALTVSDFSSTAQMVRVPVSVPLAEVPYLTFGTPGTDVEGRGYYKTSESTPYDDNFGSGATPYLPSVFATLLQQTVPHKVLYPCIGMLVEDTALGKRGTLVLLIFSRSSTDDQNAIVFTAPGTDSCVGIYRLKGNPTMSSKTRQMGHSLVEV